MNGPDVKIRGTAHHVGEKYLQLARDAQSSGDPVMAESYLQHAEHYFRIIAAAQQAQQAQFGGFNRPAGEPEAEDSDEEDEFTGLTDRSPRLRSVFRRSNSRSPMWRSRRARTANPFTTASRLTRSARSSSRAASATAISKIVRTAKIAAAKTAAVRTVVAKIAAATSAAISSSAGSRINFQS